MPRVRIIRMEKSLIENMHRDGVARAEVIQNRIPDDAKVVGCKMIGATLLFMIESQEFDDVPLNRVPYHPDPLFQYRI